MEEILIENDHYKNETTINGEKKQVWEPLHLLKEVEWKGQTFIIVQIDNDGRFQWAKGIERNAYRHSVTRTTRE